MSMRRVDARMRVLGGTFVPDNYNSSGRYCASTEFTPEIAEEEELERSLDPLRCGYLPIEEASNFDALSFVRDEEEVAEVEEEEVVQ